MSDAMRSMLREYGPIKNFTDEINALREIVQRVTLLGLYRGGFFEEASFYGGTALRLLYNLDRFSEDMDFCLKEPNLNFNLAPFFKSVTVELERFGLDARVEEKKTGPEVSIESAFVKQNTYQGLLIIGSGLSKITKGQLIKVRIEVDKLNPAGSKTCRKLMNLPTPFMVGTLTEESLFAGKLHALLARSYLNRVKGRDFYDFLFYCNRNTKVNLQYLEAKLRDSGHYSDEKELTLDHLVQLLKMKFTSVDFEKAKSDVRPFLKTEKVRDLTEWSSELFSAFAEKIQE